MLISAAIGTFRVIAPLTNRLEAEVVCIHLRAECVKLVRSFMRILCQLTEQMLK